jgi:hypothetical protein
MRDCTDLEKLIENVETWRVPLFRTSPGHVQAIFRFVRRQLDHPNHPDNLPENNQARQRVEQKNGIVKGVSPRRDLNTGPADYKSAALPTKPQGRHTILTFDGKKDGARTVRLWLIHPDLF